MALSRKKRKILRDTAIIIAITLGLLVGLEGILRLFSPEEVLSLKEIARRNQMRVEDFNIDYAYDPETLVRLKPNVEKVFTRNPVNGGEVVTWRSNSQGYRGPELREDPGQRIIVYGDSNVLARFSQYENTFVAQLGKYLKTAGFRNVEMVNAGAVGMGTDQSLIRFQNEAGQMRPDLVIFHIFADNDFGDIIRNRLFETDAQGALVKTDHERVVDLFLLGDRMRNTQSYIAQLRTVKMMQKLLLAVTGRSHEDNLAFELLNVNKAEYAVHKKSLPNQFSHFADHYDIDLALNPELESAKGKVQLMRAILKEARDFAKAQGIAFMVVIEPSVIDLTPANHVLGYPYLKKYEHYKRTNLSDAAEGICRELAIPFVNLFDLYAENEPQDLFFTAGDSHWNDKGQELTAESVAKFIIEQGILQGATQRQTASPSAADIPTSATTLFAN